VKDIFKALNDDTRREILELLKKEDLADGLLAHHFNIANPSISHHLDILQQAHLITLEKKGQFIHYSLNTTILDSVFAWLLTFEK